VAKTNALGNGDGIIGDHFSAMVTEDGIRGKGKVVSCQFALLFPVSNIEI